MTKPTDKIPERSSERLLTARDITTRLTLSRSTLHRYRQEGMFPQPVPIGVRRIAWRESDVSQWLEDRDSRRREKAA